MSNETHMELPQEVFEELLLYLDLKDLLSCSLVCSRWRSAVNSNRVWKYFCKRRICMNWQDLSSEERKLPCSSWSDETLSLCDWRKTWMNYLALKDNWRRGRYQETTLLEDGWPDFKTDYEYLIHEGFESGSDYFYKIADRPLTVDDRTPLGDRGFPFFEFSKLANGVLVRGFENRIQVSTKDRGLNNKETVCFDSENGKPNSILGNTGSVDPYSVWSSPGRYTRADHDGKYFVGTWFRGNDGSNVSFHVWDLESLTKVQEVKLPDPHRIWSRPRYSYRDLSYYIRGNTVVLVLCLVDAFAGLFKYTTRTVIFTYDLVKKCYSNGELSRPYDYRNVVTISSSKIVFPDDPSMESVLVFDFSFACLFAAKPVCPSHVVEGRRRRMISMNLCGNTLVVNEHNTFTCTGYVRVFDISKKMETDAFELPGYSDRHRRTHLCLGESFLLVESGRNDNILVRDMKTQKFIHSIQASFPFTPPHPFGTKMIARKAESNKLVMMNFW